MQKNSLPQNLKSFFWDHDPNSIDLNAHSSFVIERIAEKGTLEAVKWMMSFYTESQIKQSIFRSDNISQSTLNFWTAYFEN